MSTQTFTAAPTNASDAYFRDWGKKLSDAMTAVGFTKTADTGQVDWATVSAPGAASTYSGYEIRAFSDAEQSNNPIVVKIEYGAGVSAAANVGIRVTVGRASDGAGNLTGEISAAFVIRNGSANTTVRNCYVSGASDRISFAMFCNTTYLIVYYIERTKTSAGANNANGVNLVGAYTSVVLQQYFPASGLGYPLTPMASLCCTVPFAGAGSYGGNIGLFPIFPYIGYPDNPDLGGCIYFTGDIAADTSVTLSILGANHVYITVAGAIGTINANATAKSIALRYE